MSSLSMSTQQRAPSELRSNMRLSVIEGVTAMPLVFMSMPGNFLVATLSTDLLRFPEGIYGIIASLPAWANIFQLVAMSFMTRFATQKAICLAFSWVHLLCWIALGVALPYIPRDGSWAAFVFAISVFGASSFAFAIINVSWASWVQEWLPQRSRGKYLGRRNRALQCSIVLFLICASQTLKAFSNGDSTLAFQWIIGFSVALRTYSIVLQQSIYSKLDASQERSGSLLSKWTLILGHHSLFRFILFGAAFGLTANFMGPFFPVFMLKALKMSPSEVGYAFIITTISGALATPHWGTLIDKHGCRPSLVLSLTGWMLNGYLFFWAAPQTHWLVYLIFAIGGLFGGGFLFASFSMILKLVPKEAKTAAISLNLAATSLGGALSPIAGGYVIEWAERSFQDSLAIFHALSATHHSLILATVLILFSIREPKSSTVLQAVGSMRALRQAGTLLGLSYLANYSFFKKRNDEE